MTYEEFKDYYSEDEINEGLNLMADYSLADKALQENNPLVDFIFCSNLQELAYHHIQETYPERFI